MYEQQTRQVALYLRVSTLRQDVENQRRDLFRWADYRGHQVVAQYVDEGVSGARRGRRRPQLDELLKAATRGEFNMVACWSLDRLGRDTRHLLALSEFFQQQRIELFLHRESIDTTTAAGKLYYTMQAAMAEFERNRLRERTMEGIETARRKGRRLGRPPIPRSLESRAERLLQHGYSQCRVRRELQLSGSTVARIYRRMVEEGVLIR